MQSAVNSIVSMLGIAWMCSNLQAWLQLLDGRRLLLKVQTLSVLKKPLFQSFGASLASVFCLGQAPSQNIWSTPSVPIVHVDSVCTRDAVMLLPHGIGQSTLHHCTVATVANETCHYFSSGNVTDRLNVAFLHLHEPANHSCHLLLKYRASTAGHPHVACKPSLSCFMLHLKC